MCVCVATLLGKSVYVCVCVAMLLGKSVCV